MYTVSVEVEGVSVLLQHRYPMPDFNNLGNGSTTATGARDFSQEWRGYLYLTSAGEVFQPGVHFEQAMTKAAGSFKVTGKRGASYRELFKSGIFVQPDQIPHGISVNGDDLDADADKPLYLDVRPVVVQRARVVRIRPALKPGWHLAFEIQCIDDQIPATVVKEVLELAGKTVGVGDYRPRFGRFMVTRFEVHK